MKRTDSRERIELTGEEWLSLVRNGRVEDDELVIEVPERELLPALAELDR